MKTGRSQFRMVRKEQLMDAIRDDSYRDNAKLAEPTRCPACGASYQRGRWTWAKAPADAHVHKCPACQRIADELPGGYVTLKGPFLAEHRTEILNLVKAREARAKEEHPLQRIMGVDATADGVVVRTTDAHLARGIAIAVHEAFKGSLDMTYNKGENLLRATWKR
ncbi:MAG TPA: BCAM0308 family protein [Usitatibacter sp.]|nr:BCAM0308 family protein [Usitatibacter sp.]